LEGVKPFKTAIVKQRSWVNRNPHVLCVDPVVAQPDSIPLHLLLSPREQRRTRQQQQQQQQQQSASSSDERVPVVAAAGGRRPQEESVVAAAAAAAGRGGVVLDGIFEVCVSGALAHV
jgi:hypothetical protein